LKTIDDFAVNRINEIFWHNVYIYLQN
jgi:hypothetical protein